MTNQYMVGTEAGHDQIHKYLRLMNDQNPDDWCAFTSQLAKLWQLEHCYLDKYPF